MRDAGSGSGSGNSPKKSKPYTPPYKVSQGDVKTNVDRKRAEDYKSGKAAPSKGNPTYAQSIRAGYQAASPEARRAAADKAETRVNLKGPKTFNGMNLAASREDRIVLGEHARRVRQQQDAQRFSNPNNDISADMGIAKAWKKDHPTDETGRLQTGQTAWGIRPKSNVNTRMAAEHPGIETGTDHFVADVFDHINTALPTWGEGADKTGRAPGDYRKVAGYVDPVKNIKRVDADGGAGQIMASLDFVSNANNIASQAGHLAGDSITSGLKALDGMGGAGKFAASVIPGMAQLSALSMAPEVTGNAVKDVVDVYAQAIPGLYQLGDAAVSAATGDSTKLDAQWQGLKDMAEHPGKALHDHPLLTVMMAKGGLSAVGRTGGAVARRAGALAGPTEPYFQPGKVRSAAQAVGRAGSTQGRAPVHLPGKGQPINRVYSHDILSKQLVQKPYDRFVARSPKLQKAQAEKWERHTVDELVGGNEATRRYHHSQIGQVFAKRLPKSKNAVALTPFIARGVVRNAKTIAEDLKTRRADLVDERPNILAEDNQLPGKAHRVRSNQAQLDTIDALLADSKLMAGGKDAEKAVKAARAFARRQGVTDKHLVAMDHLDAEQAQRSKAFDYVFTHMRGSHRDETIPSEVGKAISEAEARVKDLKPKVEGAKRERESAARAERYQRGRTETVVSEKDKWHLRNDEAFMDASKAHREAAKELTAANRAFGNETRYPANDAARLAMATARKKAAETKVEQTRTVKNAALADLHRRAELEAGKAARGEKSSPLRDFGRAPAGRNRVFEKARGRLTQAERRHDNLRQELEDARRAHHLSKRSAKILGEPLEHGPSLVDKHGEPLSTKAIDEHMRANGIDGGLDHIMYVTDRPGVGGSKAHFQPNVRPPYEAPYTRSGKAAKQGLYDVSPESVYDSMSRSQGILDALTSRDRIINTLVRGTPEGGWYRSAKDAEAAARDAAEAGHDLVPYMITDMRLTKARRDAQQARFDPGVDAAVMHDNELAFEPGKGAKLNAGDMAAAPDGDYGLISRSAAVRLREHDAVAVGKDQGSRLLQELTQRWRNAVLYGTSMPKWLTGNLAEMVIRMAVAGAGPRSMIVGWKVMQQTVEQAGDPQQAAFIHNYLLGGGHFNGVMRQQINLAMRRDQARFENLIHSVSRATDEAHGPRELKALWNGYKGVINAINKEAELGGAYAAIGKLALKDRESWGHLNDGWKEAMTIGPEAAAHVGRRLLETSEQVRYARHVYSTIGRYTNLSPSARHWVQNYTPFGLWYANALKFTLLTIPRHHPLFGALLSASYLATVQDREQLKQSLWVDGALPGFLQGSVLFEGYGPEGQTNHQFSRYTPFGVMSDVGNVKSQFLPQLSNTLMALAGQDFKGTDMTRSDGSDIKPGDRLKFAAYVALETMVPLMSITHQIVDKKGKPYINDYLWSPKTKPGSQAASRGQAAKMVFLPGYGYKNGKGGKGPAKTASPDSSIPDIDISIPDISIP